MLRRALWGLSTLGAIGVAACGKEPRHPRSVVFATGADLQTVNPLLTIHPFAKQVERYVLLTTLVRYDAGLKPRPYLARTWRWSADGRSLVFVLMSGVRWSDGRPTVARDVAWTLNAARDAAAGYPRLDDLSGIAFVSDPNDSTVVVRFATPQVGLPDVFTDLAILPAHLLDTVPLEHLRQAAWNEHPVSNGPFRFVLHEANRRWVFAANREFPAALGGPPWLDRFVVVVIDEPSTKLAALTAGDVDFAGIQPVHAAFVRRNPKLALLTYPVLLPYGVVFDVHRAPFDDRSVRLAASLAVDRRAIVDGYLYGFGTPAYGPLPPGVGTIAPPRPIPTDPDSSLQLLGGRRIAFELLTVGSGEAPLEQMLQAQLTRAGFDATIRQVELTAFLDRVYGPRHDFQAAVLGIQGDLGLGYLQTLQRISGLKARADPLAAARLFQDSLPVAFLYHARGVQGVNRRVQGVRMDLRGELPTITHWWTVQ